MKKGLIILALLALAAFVLWAAPSITDAARSAFTKEDPDIPRTWKNAMSKEEYMLRREEHVALMRGIGTGLPFDPLARIQALQKLEEQQRRLLGTSTGEGTSGAGAQSQFEQRSSDYHRRLDTHRPLPDS